MIFGLTSESDVGIRRRIEVGFCLEMKVGLKSTDINLIFDFNFRFGLLNAIFLISELDSICLLVGYINSINSI